MADEPNDDELLLDTPVEQDAPENQDAAEDDDLELTFGDEAPPPEQERETGLAKHLREEIRRRDKELAELRRQQPQPRAIEVGDEPTLEGCEYDEDKFKAEWRAWNNRADEARQAETQTEATNRQAQESWAEEVRNYETKKAAITSPKAQAAIEVALASLNPVQQAVIVKAADNPANVFAALGMYPAKLQEISAIADPVKQAAAIAKLEGKLQVTNRKRAPEPEEIASGTASLKGSDATLEKLQKDADKTGDRTKLIRYRQQLKAKAK